MTTEQCNIDNFQLIINKLNAIESKMNVLENKIDEIKQQVSKCETSCKTMDDHINFVEDVYQTLRTPLDYVRFSVNKIVGNNDNSSNLPQLKDK